MSGEGIFVGLSQPIAFSGGRTLRNCKNNGEKGNVIEIDAGGNNCGNVIVIDVPDSLPKRVRGSSVSDLRKNKATIICIDDDDDNIEHISLDEVQFVQPNNNPVNISKCKQTYSEASTSRNPYGPDTYSESALVGDNSDDGPDYVLEGSAGKIKEEWEKAFLKRQNNALAGDYQNGTGKMTHEPYSSPKTTNDFFNSPTSTNAISRYFGRESYKATDEYKRAAEIEWESRQKLLRIQAEEAAAKRREKEAAGKIREKEAAAAKIREKEAAAAKIREKEEVAAKIREKEEAAAKIREKEEARQLVLLQKRKLAESSRLLDMEKRQKQRVDEMRETQKKVEDNLNLKEKLRAEVRKELSKLETTCRDMASILRGLNVNLNGGTANDVRIAFKRSLLSFHPDRASQSDVRQQVEAEEKFKLINRMKEKFSFAT